MSTIFKHQSRAVFYLREMLNRWLLQASCLLLILHWAMPCNAADERQWEFSNYRIQIHLAVDTTARPQPNLKKQITEHLQHRIQATLYPLWSVNFSPSTGPLEHTLLHQLDDLPEQETIKPSIGFDKQMFLTITATAEGYLVACREQDLTTNMWSPVLHRQTRQPRVLSQHCFDLLRKTFAPLAKIRKDIDDESHVSLYFKGSSLPRHSSEPLFAQPGTVYQPLKIRKSRHKAAKLDAISKVPWTYLTLESMQDDIGRCQVHSGIRKPFGVRRRGSVENLAIALPQSSQSTRVRFYARHDKSQGLVGYEVFQRDADGQASRPIGLTDAHGVVEVQHSNVSVTTLFLRSDGQLLAKVPVASGVLSKVEVPIADDNARLKAQATLTSLREKLIDLVARRNILIARIRDQAANNHFDEAHKLLGKLDALPGRAYFAQLLSTAERNQRNRSTEPRVQVRIEKMFANTRKLLGSFLSAKQISDLRRELNAAQQSSVS